MHRATITVLLLSTATALAAPPPGTDTSGAEHRWWECHRQSKPPYQSCCSLNDGHVLGDGEWRGSGSGDGYEIRIEGNWWPVPPEAVIGAGSCGPEPDVNDQTSAKVWYAPSWDDHGKLLGVLIYCFIAGTMY